MQWPFARLAVLCAMLLAACAPGTAAPNFTLIDDRATTWTLAEQHTAILLTFGFAHCADTCPATLAKLSRLANSFGPRAGDLEITFVTVDPARDTPAALHRFVARFQSGTSSRIAGLTGTPSQIATVESAYHVWAAKTRRNGRDAFDYDVAHSAQIFFITRTGRIAEIRDDDDSSATLARALREILG